MDLPFSPFSTTRICSAGSAALTTGSPASGGNAPGTPLPSAPWQSAQVPANSLAPSAALKVVGGRALPGGWVSAAALACGPVGCTTGAAAPPEPTGAGPTTIAAGP